MFCGREIMKISVQLGRGKKDCNSQSILLSANMAAWPISYRNMCSTNQSIFRTINSVLFISLTYITQTFKVKHIKDDLFSSVPSFFFPQSLKPENFKIRGRGVQIFFFFCHLLLSFKTSHFLFCSLLRCLRHRLKAPSASYLNKLLHSGKQQLFSQVFIQVFKSLEILFVCFKLLSNQNKNISSLDSQSASILIITPR